MKGLQTGAEPALLDVTLQQGKSSCTCRSTVGSVLLDVPTTQACYKSRLEGGEILQALPSAAQV